MIDAIEIIEVMTSGAVTIYTQVFSSDYKRRWWMYVHIHTVLKQTTYESKLSTVKYVVVFLSSASKIFWWFNLDTLLNYDDEVIIDFRAHFRQATITDCY